MTETQILQDGAFKLEITQYANNTVMLVIKGKGKSSVSISITADNFDKLHTDLKELQRIFNYDFNSLYNEFQR